MLHSNGNQEGLMLRTADCKMNSQAYSFYIDTVHNDVSYYVPEIVTI